MISAESSDRFRRSVNCVLIALLSSFWRINRTPGGCRSRLRRAGRRWPDGRFSSGVMKTPRDNGYLKTCAPAIPVARQAGDPAAASATAASKTTTAA